MNDLYSSMLQINELTRRLSEKDKLIRSLANGLIEASEDIFCQDTKDEFEAKAREALDSITDKGEKE